jgi:uncharacterized protein (TIGR03032 family)
MQQVIILAAPRSGGGLVHELILQHGHYSSGKLSSRDFLRVLDNDGLKPDELVEALALEGSEEGAIFDYSPFLGVHAEVLVRALPNALYVQVLRQPIHAIVSGIRAWETGRFANSRQPEGWWGQPWSFGLIPEAENLTGKPLPEIVAEQFLSTSSIISRALETFRPNRLVTLTFEDLVADPNGTINSLLNSVDFASNSASFSSPLPWSSRSLPGLSRIPGSGNLTEAVAALQAREKVLSDVVQNWQRAKKGPQEQSNSESLTASSAPSDPVQQSSGTPFSSVFSNSFAKLLEASSSSVAISTYKSGHLIMASEFRGAVNTTFQPFARPMGIAVAGTKLALGTLDSIVSFNNQPGLSKAVEPKDFYDSVYAPRSRIFTGDISIHEMAYGLDGDKSVLYFINTAFSCLCKSDPEYSFIPVWRPSWISGLANEDRCHLNGLAVVNGKPKFVTALSQTDLAFGWRSKKGISGVIVDVEEDRVVASGLSMPHSPRWHEGNLWVLESGKGSLASVDTETGQVTSIATLPGFTRGLAFIGPFALVGLSQVRESVFNDLPVTDSKDERNAGVWVVDTRTGEVAGRLKFDGAVTEIFDVQVIPNSRRATVVEPNESTKLSYTLPDFALKQVVQPQG